VVVDTFSFLGTAPCAALLPPAGPLSSITGIWQPHLDASTGALTWVVAPAECSDLGFGTATSRTGTAPATTDVAQLRSSFAAGRPVTVRGVVTAVKATTRSYTFTLQDPGAGVNSAITVVRVKRTGITLGVPPNVGDAVTVTGTTSVYAATAEQEIKL
jgi:predicted extracellular nuclease